MTDRPLTIEAARQFLQPIAPAEAWGILLRPAGRDWQLVLRSGRIDPDQALEAVAEFDAAAGGTVVPAAGAPGWLARYFCAAPGVDLCLLGRFPPLSPDQLQPALEAMEDRAGWILVAALQDLSTEAEVAGAGPELVLDLLLDAASAGSLSDLAQHWIARLEREFRPGAVLVVRTGPLGSQVMAISGGATVSRAGSRQEALCAIADALRERRLPFQLSLSDPGAAGLPSWQLERILPQMRALELESLVALPVGSEAQLEAVVLLAGAEGAAPVLPAAQLQLLSRALSDSFAVQIRARPRLRQRIGAWAGGRIAALFGPAAWKLKLTAAGAALVLLILALVPGTERPAFSAGLETAGRRVIAAPYDGYLAAAPWRTGDHIPAGALMLAMDTAELDLQRVMTEAEQTRLSTQARLSRAKGDIAQLRSLEAELEQTKIRLELIARQIAEGEMRAPRPVQVLSGEAHLRIGARLRLGEPLLEIGDPETLSVNALIDEDWVADLQPGLEGDLMLSAWPERLLRVRLVQISADARAEEGRYGFRSRLEFAEPPPEDLRPAMLEGMRGVVRLEAGRSSLLAGYTRGIRRWLQGALWRLS